MIGHKSIIMLSIDKHTLTLKSYVLFKMLEYSYQR